MPDMILEREGTEGAPERRRAGYRTKDKARETTPITSRKLAVITDSRYSHALTAIPEGSAYIIPVSEVLGSSLEFKDGILDPNDYHLSFPRDFDRKQLGELRGAVLGAAYSVILRAIEDEVKKAGTPEKIMDILTSPEKFSATLYVPEFMAMMGMDPNQGQDRAYAAIRKLRQFSNVVGIHLVEKYGKVYDNQYAVIQWDKYEKTDNTISFSSPYLTHIAKTVLLRNMAMDMAGLPDTTAGGHPRIRPCHSYLLDGALASERNVPAVEIVSYVIRLIETAGSRGIPHAKARAILDECPELKCRIEETGRKSDKNKKLERAFARAYEILADPKYSYLLSEKGYVDIEIPTAIPKMQTLDTLTLSFPHKGKAKARRGGDEEPQDGQDAPRRKKGGGAS